MADILYLVHRMPWPPDKGDKVRSHHVLQHLLARGHRVHLGTFCDDPADLAHVDALRARCASLHVARLNPRTAKLASLAALATGGALTMRHYHDAALLRWVRETAARVPLSASLVFSSSMAPYAQALLPRVPMLVDFVDMDSAKWAQYAGAHRWPLSWLYAREGRELLAAERAIAAQARRAFFVSEAECALFRARAPECAAVVEACGNGVDAEFFAPDAARPSPFAAGRLPVVFTGAMDYWPNVDAVGWFVQDIWPALRARVPQASFHIVGRNPAPAVRALAGPGVEVTGTVPDVRPWLQHAAAVVAPLRLARGIQNKVLEAMAMGRPVVAARSCAQALGCADGHGLLAAESPAEYVEQLATVLQQPAVGDQLGRAARRHVLAQGNWELHLAPLDHALAALSPPPAPRAAARPALAAGAA